MKGESTEELEAEEPCLGMKEVGTQRSTKIPLAVTPGRKRRIFEPASSQECEVDMGEQPSEGDERSECDGEVLQKHNEACQGALNIMIWGIGDLGLELGIGD
eukprot:42941-Lingulodinium_polyedra.AAC.1